MNTNEHELTLDELAHKIIGAAYQVSSTLGSGFLEKVYERALVIELTANRLKPKAQQGFPIFYKGQSVGTYCADIVVENRIIVELKCVDCFVNEHLAQCLNYLKASHLKLALLINFQKPTLEWKRLVLDK
jgi:GxxExxY protein